MFVLKEKKGIVTGLLYVQIILTLNIYKKLSIEFDSLC